MRKCKPFAYQNGQLAYKCSCCGEYKARKEFYQDKSVPCGIRSACKGCIHVAYRRKHPLKPRPAKVVKMPKVGRYVYWRHKGLRIQAEYFTVRNRAIRQIYEVLTECGIGHYAVLTYLAARYSDEWPDAFREISEIVNKEIDILNQAA